MKRYKIEKLLKLGPVDGFMIHTPDGRKLRDTHPQTIVRELNAANVEMNEKRKDIVYLATEKAKLENYVKRLEEAGDALLELCDADESQFHLADQIDARCEKWLKAKEAKL